MFVLEFGLIWPGEPSGGDHAEWHYSPMSNVVDRVQYAIIIMYVLALKMASNAGRASGQTLHSFTHSWHMPPY